MADTKTRKDTTQPHPLFEGDVKQFWSDSKWRADIPRAGATRPRAAGLLADREEFTGWYKFGGKN